MTISALFFYATPAFWLGLMLIIAFSLKLDLLPTSGMETIGAGFDGAEGRAVDIAWHLILPATTMALYYLAIYTRLMRASMLEVLQLDFVRTARAKGLSERSVAFGHAAQNALLPVVTIAGLQVRAFHGRLGAGRDDLQLAGLGRLVFDALLQRDINLLMGIFLISSVIVVLANLAADLVYGWLDPRMSTGEPMIRWNDFWHVYRQNHAAVLGLVALCLIILAAIFGPMLYPVDPFEMVDRPFSGPSEPIRSGRTRSGATSRRGSCTGGASP